MRPLHVLFFIPSFAGGGAERQCAYLANGLSSLSDFKVSLAYFHEGVNHGLVDRTQVGLIKIRSRSNYDPRIAWRLKRLIETERPDIVFSWLHASDVFTWCARRLGAQFKWVMAERNSWYPADVRFWLRDRVGRQSDLIVSNSEKGDLYWEKRGVPSVRRRIADNVLPDAWFDARPHSPEAQLVCFAGRMEPQKDIQRLADAFLLLAKERKDVKFVLAGEGSLREDVCVRVKDEASISCIGFQQNVRPLFERTSVFVNISVHEGKPNTVIENLATGNRVVLSRIPEHIELVGEDYPFLVDCGADPATIASLIERALSTPMHAGERLALHHRLEPMRLHTIVERYASMFVELTSSHVESAHH
jgi:Glycosyltransferase